MARSLPRPRADRLGCATWDVHRIITEEGFDGSGTVMAWPLQRPAWAAMPSSGPPMILTGRQNSSNRPILVFKYIYVFRRSVLCFLIIQSCFMVMHRGRSQGVVNLLSVHSGSKFNEVDYQAP